MSSDQQDTIKSEIETREADQLFFHAPVALIGHAGAALLCVVLFYKSIPPIISLPWLGLMLLSLLLRGRVIRGYSTRNRYAPVSKEVASYQTHVVITGVLWCACYLYGAANLALAQFIYLPFIICALLAGTTIVYNCQLRVFLTFASITTVLPSLYLLVLANPEKQVFGLITLMWFGYLCLIALETRKYLSRSARCEIENLALLSELRRERNRANMMLEQLRKRTP